MKTATRETDARIYQKDVRITPGGGIALSAATTTFGIESFDQIIDDIKPLLAEHWEELAAYPEVPLAPDFAFYRQAHAMGHIRFYAARIDGALVGYLIMSLMQRHPHYTGQPWAISDIVLVRQEHRTRGLGMGLFDLMERDLKGFVVQVGQKNAHPELGVLLSMRGYTPIETNWSKRLT